MLDIRFVRENPEIVKQNIRNKFQDKKLPLVDEVIALDAENRAAMQEADALRGNRNKLSKQIGGLMAKGLKDEAEAVRWYLKSAELGYSEAQFDLGMRYNMGWGIQKDDVESAKWYLKAAEQGDLASQSVMGNFYEKGIGK